MIVNQVKIKIFGELTAIKAEAAKIKNLHSVYIESEYMPNDDGLEYRVYLTVPIENKNSYFGANLSTEQPQNSQATQTAHHTVSELNPIEG